MNGADEGQILVPCCQWPGQLEQFHFIGFLCGILDVKSGQSNNPSAMQNDATHSADQPPSVLPGRFVIHRLIRKQGGGRGCPFVLSTYTESAVPQYFAKSKLSIDQGIEIRSASAIPLTSAVTAQRRSAATYCDSNVPDCDCFEIHQFH